jgi:hypothetical protein
VDEDGLADQLEAGLFAAFAACELGFALALLVDDARDNFELPGRQPGEMSGQAELLDEHDFVAIGIVENDADGAAALEDVALDFGAPAAAKKLVAKAITLEAEEAAMEFFPPGDLNPVVVHHSTLRTSGGSDNLACLLTCAQPAVAQ